MGYDGIQIKSVPFFWSPPCYICPTGSDVRFLADTLIKDFAHVEYWETVRLLLLAGFCLLLCCSSAFGEDIFKPTGKYLQVTTGDSEPVTLERTDNPTRFKFSTKSAGPPALSRYLVKFTSDTCGPCKSWEAKERPSLDAAGVAITIVDCTHGNTWGVTRVPEFWVVDKEPRKVVEKFKGYTTAEVLYDSLSESVLSCELLGETEQLPATMSHSEMVAMHNRLHGGGSWTWPGDLATHLRTTHGVSTSQPTQSQPARVQQSANCPGGNCPTNRTQRRRGGMLGGMFR